MAHVGMLAVAVAERVRFQQQTGIQTVDMAVVAKAVTQLAGHQWVPLTWVVAVAVALEAQVLLGQMAVLAL
jgi:hypothetical protein